MDRIQLEGIEVWAHHGVLAHERELGQRFTLDVVVELDLSDAAASDRLDATIDYGALAQRVHDAVASDPAQLLETVAGRVVALCLDDPRVEAAEVTLHKPCAPLGVLARDVAVQLRRERAR